MFWGKRVLYLVVSHRLKEINQAYAHTAHRGQMAYARVKCWDEAHASVVLTSTEGIVNGLT